jgi:hypothetical protein
MSLSFVTNAHRIAERETSSSLSSSLVSDYKKWVSFASQTSVKCWPGFLFYFPFVLCLYLYFPNQLIRHTCEKNRWTSSYGSSRRRSFHSRPGKLSKLNFCFLFCRSIIQNEDKWNRLSNRLTLIFFFFNIPAGCCWIDRELTSRIASNAPKSLDFVWLPNFHCPFTCTEWQPKKEVTESPCRKSGPASTKESIKK